MAIDVQGIINKSSTKAGQSTVPKGKVNQSIYGVSPLTQQTLQSKKGTVLPSSQSYVGGQSRISSAQIRKLQEEANKIQKSLDEFTKMSGKGKQSVLGASTSKSSSRSSFDDFEEEDSGGGGSPTVMTNATKIERVIPLLESQANNLSISNLSSGGGTGSTFADTDTTSTDSFGGEESGSFEDIFGTTDGKKKKPEEEDPLLQQQMALIESMQRNADANTKQTLNSIKTKFNQREAQQKSANQQGMASVKQALNLGGSSRYAPISSQGIISSAEAAGIRALSALDSEEQSLIAEVKSAQQTQDYRLLEKKLGLLETVRSEKAETASALEESMREAEAQSQMDTTIAEAVTMEGLTDPISIFNYAKAQGVDVPISTITKALEGINKLSGDMGIGGTGFSLDNKAIGQLLGSGFTAPDIKALQADLNSGASIDDILEGVTDADMQNTLKEAFGLKSDTNTNVTPGAGAKTPMEEAVIRTRMFGRIAPMLNKGAISDSDAERINGFINEMRDSGMGEQQIYDSLAGLPPEINSPYNGTFRDLIVSNSETMEKQTSNMGRLGQQLSSGNYQGAMNTVEGLALTEARKLDPDGYMGTNTAQNYIKKADKLTSLLSDAEDIIGPLDGTWETVKGKLFKSKSPKAAEISAAVAQLVAEMRNDLSGTAVTASETAFLEPLIPSLSDQMGNFKIKTKSLKDNALNQYNSTRSTVSLPTVTAEMVIDPKKRLQLYSNDIYLPANGTLDI